MYPMMLGAALASIASGLVSTLNVDTSMSKWIGYLVLLGVGYGFTFQVGTMVGQASAEPEDMAVATSAISCNFPLL